MHCGFIPVGTGMRQLYESSVVDARERERIAERNLGLERAPGSRNGLIFTAIALSLMGFSYDQRIWVNNWEVLRLGLGDARPIRVVGNWGVTDAQELDEAGSAHKDDGLYGTIQFGDNGAVRLSLFRGVERMEATGLYTQSGKNIYLRQLTGTNGASPLPEQVKLSLDWTHGDTMQMDIEDQERLTLIRIRPDSQ
jgi:hypothetical protein